ncbi:MAG: helix-turn-helix domain-containing protein [Roseivirga sp.]|nr:helix-turn-helix domain-containing protein [Roseivirga sp.]
MNNKELTRRLKELRKRKGFSQEELAEKTGLSLRTIQRIENGETEPRSDSLKRLSRAFDIPADEIIDWTIKEDRGFLMSLNLSGLIAVLFPILGILVTLMMWLSKKDKVHGAKQLGRSILNFQITLTVLYLLGSISTIFMLLKAFDDMQATAMSGAETTADSITSAFMLQLLIYGVFNAYNIVFTIVNTLRIKRGKEARYFP